MDEDGARRTAPLFGMAPPEGLLSSALDASSDAIAISRVVDGRLVYVNDACIRLTGYDRAELIGQRFLDLDMWEDPADRSVLVEGLERDGSVGRRGVRGRTKGRTVALIELTASRIEAEGQRFIVWIGRDVTERERLEHGLRETEGRGRLTHDLALAVAEAPTAKDAIGATLRMVAETAGWAMGLAWLVDERGGHLECSPAWYGATDDLKPFRRASESMRFPPGVGLPGRVWATAQPLWIEDVTADDNFPRAPHARDVGLVAGAGVPVLVGDEVGAVLEFFVPERREEDGRFLDMLTTVAAHLGSVMQRKVAEEAVRESQNLYRRVVESSHDMITLIDGSARILYASPSFRRVLGYVPDDLLGSSKLEMVHPGDRPAILEALRQMAGGGRPYLPLVRLRDAGGSWVFVETRGVAIPEDSGEPRTFLVSAHDLTDRRRAEEELLEVVRRYKTLVEHVPAITYTDAVDDQMTTLFISPQVESILGYTPDEWTADPGLWYRRLDQEDRSRALATYLEGRDSGKPFVFEYRMLSRDGREVWFRDSATVVCDPMGQPALVHGIMLDVTELKRAEAALRTALERERLASEGLKALDLMRNTFLRAASHELRTPITISRGHLEVLGDEPDPDDVRSAIRVVIGELGRMGRIVDDITTLVRMEDPRFLRMKDVALGAFVADVAAKAGPLLGGRLRLEDTPADASARADPQRLTQALLNLLQNAAVHTNGTTPVRLRVVEQPDAWRFEVADGGGGLPPGEEERVFQPFQRATSTAPGSGLGLAIVRGIAEAHGGSAGADNYPGKGVTFWVLLPR